MNIKAIRLRNFRGFRDASIELKPLTVLLGPNSAGKSAFGHALAAMAHAHKGGRSGPLPSLTAPKMHADDWPIDLGETNDLRTMGAEGPVQIGLETSAGWVGFGFGGLDQCGPGLSICRVVHPSGEQSMPAGAPVNAEVMGHPSTQSDTVPLEGLVHDIDAAIELTRINELQWQDGTTPVAIILDGLIVKAVTHDTGTSRVLSGAATTDLRLLLEKLTYLRATRKRPSRGYRDDVGQWQPIGYSGEWTPSILLRRGHEQITYYVPPGTPQSTAEAQTMDYEWKKRQETLLDALGTWLSGIKIAGGVTTIPPSLPDTSVRLRVTLKNDQTSHDITEVGFGVSQIVPVLVAGLLQPQDSVFIVDLPEAHLHPRPQGAVADFFCSLALSGRSSLVETHSEMFFHRLRLRAAMDPWLMENIAVYFIDPPKDGVCSTPRLVGLRFEDELRWPEGFLEEGWEMEAQINAVRKARKA